MRRSSLSKGSLALTSLALLSAQFLAGCSDEQHQSGTAVNDTPEAQAGRKASMDGMKAIMEKGQPKGAESSK
jgi:hypothetical protein